MGGMQLLLKDIPVMEISETGACRVLAPELLPYALRRETVTFYEAGPRRISAHADRGLYSE